MPTRSYRECARDAQAEGQPGTEERAEGPDCEAGQFLMRMVQHIEALEQAVRAMLCEIRELHAEYADMAKHIDGIQAEQAAARSTPPR